MLWPPRETLDKYEVEGLKIAFKVLNNLGSEMPEEQTEELAGLLIGKAGWDGSAEASNPADDPAIAREIISALKDKEKAK